MKTQKCRALVEIFTYSKSMWDSANSFTCGKDNNNNDNKRRPGNGDGDYQTEHLDSVTPNLFGFIIGKKGSTIKAIKRQSGADVIIQNDGKSQEGGNGRTNGGGMCLLKGDIQQRNTARSLILETVSNGASHKHDGERNETMKTTADAFSRGIKVKYSSNSIKHLRGDNLFGKNRWDNSNRTNWRDTTERSSSQPLKTGELTRVLNRPANNEESYPDFSFGEDWRELKFARGHTGLVVGKGGKTIKKIEKIYGVSLKAIDKKLFIHGDPSTQPEIKKAVHAIEYFMWSLTIRTGNDLRYAKIDYFVGDPSSVTVVTNLSSPSLSFLKNPSKLESGSQALDLKLWIFMANLAIQNFAAYF